MTAEQVKKVSAVSAQFPSKRSDAGKSTSLFNLTRALRFGIALEFEITWRMSAHNFLASIVPLLTFATAVCFRQQLQPQQMVVVLGKASLLACLYGYTFDASNQARGAVEDKLNKPSRPIPVGILTPTGAMHRFWISTVIYAVVGWFLDVLEYVLIWQITTIIMNVWCSPPHCIWCKPFCMFSGVVAQLAQAWKVVAPIDETGKMWIPFLAAAFVPPIIFEDIRDMEGDKAIGRRTFALLFGDFPVRIWFTSIMAIMPVLVHNFLFKLEATTLWRLVSCDILVATVCWTAAVRSLWLQDAKADRVTYQLYCVAYLVVLFSACILWA